MTENEAREAIYQRFVTQWGSTSSFTFDNESFDPPSTSSWVRVAVRNQTSQQGTLGPVNGRKFERFGMVLIQVFVEVNTGTATMDTLTRTARAIFEGVRVSEDLRFTNAVVREIPPDGKWYRAIVEAEFSYTEVK